MSVDAPVSVARPAHAPVVQVLGLGLRSPELLPSFGPSRSIVGSSREDVLDELSGLTRSGGPVLVLYPSWAVEPISHWVRVARTALRTTQVLAYETTLPPVGSGVLTTLAGALAAHVPSAGALLSLLPVMERAFHDIALLPAVHKLSDPNPSIWQHARSVAGSESFAVVQAGKQRRVVTLKRSGFDLRLPGSRDGMAVYVASNGVDVMRMYRILERYYPRARVYLDPDAEDPGGYWGGDSWTEAVAYPMRVESLLHLSRRARALVDCRWCGAEGPPVERICQFCGVALSPSSLLGEDA